MKIGVITAVMNNFKGYTRLMESVDVPVLPLPVNNWDHNTGCAGGWNRGIDMAVAAGCTHAIICNDDTEFEPGTIMKLVEAIDDGAGFVVSAINRRDQKEDLPYEIRPGCDYSCFMLKPQEFFDTVGRFDENLYPAYFEDNDMERRIILSGNRPVHRTDAMHFHRGSETQNFGGGTVVTSEMFERNREYYIRKWGDSPTWERWDTPFNRSDMTYKDWIPGYDGR